MRWDRICCKLFYLCYFSFQLNEDDLLTKTDRKLINVQYEMRKYTLGKEEIISNSS